MKTAVAMSGGVDSSAAAAILKEQGHELVGFTMQLWNQRRGISLDENGEPLPSRCCSLDDVYDARRVAEELGFPFYVLNLEKEFERDVVQPFVNSYLNGETPIPCSGAANRSTARRGRNRDNEGRCCRRTRRNSSLHNRPAKRDRNCGSASALCSRHRNGP